MADENDRPIGSDFAALLPLLSQTMKLAVQSLRQSGAVVSVLVAKGIATREEFDKALAESEDLAKMYRGILDSFDKKPD
jgi:hypothetical protein